MPTGINPEIDRPLMDPESLQTLLARIRQFLGADEPEEKRMFGCVAFMVRNHMTCGASRKGLMVRVGPENDAMSLTRPYARRCEGSGRPMPGFIMVELEGVNDDAKLADWLGLARNYVLALPDKKPKARKNEAPRK